MLLRPTHTDQKLDSHLLDESQTRWVLGCMSLRPTPPRRESLKICMDARKTRRGWDEYGHIHRKPGGDGTNMAISTENPAGIGRKWPYLPKTRRGWDEYGHIHRKPGEDWTNMAISTENPARIGQIWPYLSKTRRGLDEYGHIYRKPGEDRVQYGYSYRILAVDRMLYVFGNHIFGKDGIRITTCGLYLFYIGRQIARTGVDVSRQECRATCGMRSVVCARQFFTLRFPSLAHSPSPSYC